MSKTPALFPPLIFKNLQMPLSWCFLRAWKNFWYFIQKDHMCTAVSRAIYSQGRPRDDCWECSKESRARLCLRPHLILLPDFFGDATFRSEFLALGAWVSIPGGWGPRGNPQLAGLLVHARSCVHFSSELMRHPPIFIQLLFQWLWAASVRKTKLPPPAMQAVWAPETGSTVSISVCVQVGVVIPRAPGSPRRHSASSSQLRAYSIGACSFCALAMVLLFLLTPS